MIQSSKAIDHFEDNFTSSCKAELLHYFLDFFWVNGSSMILIKKVKSLFEAIIIRLADPVLPRSRLRWGLSDFAFGWR